jgi:hypothetical protein
MRLQNINFNLWNTKFTQIIFRHWIPNSKKKSSLQRTVGSCCCLLMIFWVATLYKLVRIYQRFGETLSIFRTSYESARYQSPEQQRDIAENRTKRRQTFCGSSAVTEHCSRPRVYSGRKITASFLKHHSKRGKKDGKGKRGARWPNSLSMYSINENIYY